MKVVTIFMTIVLVSGLIFGSTADSRTRRFNLAPNSSKNFSFGVEREAKVEVSTISRLSGQTTGSGRVRVSVYNQRGKRVASGINKVRFKTGNIKAKYRFVFKNMTKKRLRVTARIITVGVEIR